MQIFNNPVFWLAIRDMQMTGEHPRLWKCSKDSGWELLRDILKKFTSENSLEMLIFLYFLVFFDFGEL